MVFPTPAGAAFPARASARGPVALVKLAEGCDRDCSFCAIPSFRGPFRSRRPTEVLDEVAWLAGQGVSEVCLVAENSTSYGKDLGGREALIQLLRDLAGVDGLRRVRLNYLQPDELTPGLLEEMAANPVVCSYFDLSLQHASAPLLRRMRRGGSAGRFLDLVGRIRALDPDAAFRSNFILGFPGDTLESMASRVGITSWAKGRFGPSTALGTLEMPMIELASFYATIADGGASHCPGGAACYPGAAAAAAGAAGLWR